VGRFITLLVPSQIKCGGDCSPFRIKGAWSEEFKLYSIGRETVCLGLYLAYEGYKEDPRQRAPAPLSPDPLAYAFMRRPLKYFADGSGVKRQATSLT
jgi:hypothetical protein